MSFIVTPKQFAQRAEFYHQLAQLTSAGIGVLSALEQLKHNPPARSYREPIQRLLAELVQGRTLTGSLQQLDAWLPEFDIALIDAGERSGRLRDYFHYRAAVRPVTVQPEPTPAVFYRSRTRARADLSGHRLYHLRHAKPAR
jgi:hypothetical protein